MNEFYETVSAMDLIKHERKSFASYIQRQSTSTSSMSDISIGGIRSAVKPSPLIPQISENIVFKTTVNPADDISAMYKNLVYKKQPLSVPKEQQLESKTVTNLFMRPTLVKPKAQVFGSDEDDDEDLPKMNIETLKKQAFKREQEELLRKRQRDLQKDAL